MAVPRRTFLKGGLSAAAGLWANLSFQSCSRGRSRDASGTEADAVPKRWAMAVDLEACTAAQGCRECIAACHQIHNVPDFGNDKDEIKWIWTAPTNKVFPENERLFPDEMAAASPVPVLCNHCDKPPCVKFCPTGATWKRDDGIVMVDFHRCIGCRYCMAGCPYGSRSFNWKDPRPRIARVNVEFPTRTKGVVEKCNFCEERIGQNLSPACVIACPENALAWGDLNNPASAVSRAISARTAIERQPELGTGPHVFYLI